MLPFELFSRCLSDSVIATVEKAGTRLCVGAQFDRKRNKPTMQSRV
jgi:hypothetical protein